MEAGDLIIDIPSTPDILRDDGTLLQLSPRRRKAANSPAGSVDGTCHQLPSPQRCIGANSRSTAFAYDPFKQAYSLPSKKRSMGRDRHGSGSGSAEESEPLTRHDSTTETPDSRPSVDHTS